MGGMDANGQTDGQTDEQKGQLEIHHQTRLPDLARREVVGERGDLGVYGVGGKEWVHDSGLILVQL